MTSGSRTRAHAVMLVAACLVTALAGQAGADALAANASGVETNRAIGRAASSYLTGLTTFAAAALWNRVDPVMHNYYENVPLDQQLYVLSTITAVQALDPHAVQSYYIGSWILARNDRVEDGLAMARHGVEANPESGILWTGYAQMLLLYADNPDEAVRAGEASLDPRMQWTDPVEQVNAYATLTGVFRTGGRPDLVANARARIVEMERDAGQALGAEDHDHDGDGVADH